MGGGLNVETNLSNKSQVLDLCVSSDVIMNCYRAESVSEMFPGELR